MFGRPISALCLESQLVLLLSVTLAFGTSTATGQSGNASSTSSDGGSSSEASQESHDTSDAGHAASEDWKKTQTIHLTYRQVVLIARPYSSQENSLARSESRTRGTELLLMFDPEPAGSGERTLASPKSIEEIKKAILDLPYADHWHDTGDDPALPSARMDLKAIPLEGPIEGAAEGNPTALPAEIVGIISKLQARLETSDGRPSQRSANRTFLRHSETAGAEGKGSGKIEVLKLELEKGQRVSNIIEIVPVPRLPEADAESSKAELGGEGN